MKLTIDTEVMTTKVKETAGKVVSHFALEAAEHGPQVLDATEVAIRGFGRGLLKGSSLVLSLARKGLAQATLGVAAAEGALETGFQKLEKKPDA